MDHLRQFCEECLEREIFLGNLDKRMHHDQLWLEINRHLRNEFNPNMMTWDNNNIRHIDIPRAKDHLQKDGHQNQGFCFVMFKHPIYKEYFRKLKRVIINPREGDNVVMTVNAEVKDIDLKRRKEAWLKNQDEIEDGARDQGGDWW